MTDRKLSHCQKLAEQIEAAYDRLHEVRLGENPAEIQTATERTRWNVANESRILSQIRHLETQYRRGSCDVLLGDAAPILPQNNRKPIKPFFK